MENNEELWDKCLISALSLLEDYGISLTEDAEANMYLNLFQHDNISSITEVRNIIDICTSGKTSNGFVICHKPYFIIKSNVD